MRQHWHTGKCLPAKGCSSSILATLNFHQPQQPSYLPLLAGRFSYIWVERPCFRVWKLESGNLLCMCGSECVYLPSEQKNILLAYSYAFLSTRTGAFTGTAYMHDVERTRVRQGEFRNFNKEFSLNHLSYLFLLLETTSLLRYSIEFRNYFFVRCLPTSLWITGSSWVWKRRHFLLLLFGTFLLQFSRFSATRVLFVIRHLYICDNFQTLLVSIVCFFLLHRALSGKKIVSEGRRTLYMSVL